MKQTDVLKRIEMPNPNINNEYVCYEDKMQPQLDFESEELEAVYQRHEAELLSVAEKAAWDYLLDFEAWDADPEEDWYYPAPSVRPPIDDYLGMEYTFYYDSETDTFEFDGFNTDSI